MTAAAQPSSRLTAREPKPVLDAAPASAAAAVDGPAAAMVDREAASAIDRRHGPRDVTRPTLDLVVPVFNEVRGLPAAIDLLCAHVRGLPFSVRITIADNASTDGTWEVACALADSHDGVVAVHLPGKGRGRALHAVWSTSAAPVLAYTDVDLSTDLDALAPLVAPLLAGEADVAIGSRLAPGARVVRGPRRELISRSYNVVVRLSLRSRVSDAQCGFKAIRADAARRLLPRIRDRDWFFDTELLVLAEREGLRVHEVPVHWVDDPDSRVALVATAVSDLRGIARVLRERRNARRPGAAGRGRQPGRPGVAGQLVRFGLVGAGSTLAYLLLFSWWRTDLGPQTANLLALLVTAVANTAVNRRVTFGVRGSAEAGRAQVQGLVVFGLGLGLTSAALRVLPAADPRPGRLTELAVLVAANLAATVLRFVLLRAWVFRSRAR